jgi:hypothetical protein
MRNQVCSPTDGPRNIIRWQGVRPVLDHGREHDGQSTLAPATVKKGTRL